MNNVDSSIDFSDDLLYIVKMAVDSIQKQYSNADYLATIVKVVDSNTYRINSNGVVYTVSNGTPISYSVGDTVWVRRPNGSRSNNFIIAKSKINTKDDVDVLSKYYTKLQVDNKLDNLRHDLDEEILEYARKLSNFYTKEQIDDFFDNYYSKDKIDILLSNLGINGYGKSLSYDGTTLSLLDENGNILKSVQISGGGAVIDNLTSTATDKALSANQGRVLAETIGDVGRLADLINRKII